MMVYAHDDKGEGVMPARAGGNESLQGSSKGLGFEWTWGEGNNNFDS